MTGGITKLANTTLTGATQLTKTVAKKASANIGLFAEALPTGTLTLSAKQAENLDKFANSFLNEDAKGLFGIIKELLAKGKERLLTITTKEDPSGIGKALSLAVEDKGQTVARIETNSSFLGEIADAVAKIKQAVKMRHKDAEKVIS